MESKMRRSTGALELRMKYISETYLKELVFFAFFSFLSFFGDEGVDPLLLVLLLIFPEVVLLLLLLLILRLLLFTLESNGLNGIVPVELAFK